MVNSEVSASLSIIVLISPSSAIVISPVPDSECLCGHAYLAHVIDLQDDPNNPNNTRRRGPNRAHNCCGFFCVRSNSYLELIFG
jgi:hypothetical protein